MTMFIVSCSCLFPIDAHRLVSFPGMHGGLGTRLRTNNLAPSQATLLSTLLVKCMFLTGFGFPRASSGVSAGTNDGEAPAILIHFGFFINERGYNENIDT